MITDREKKNMRQFYRAVLALEDEEECRRFFDDVATIKEVLDLSARHEVARLLSEGEGDRRKDRRGCIRPYEQGGRKSPRGVKRHDVHLFRCDELHLLEARFADLHEFQHRSRAS